MDLIDESGEIRCTGFNEEVDTFYDLFEVGLIYFLGFHFKILFSFAFISGLLLIIPILFFRESLTNSGNFL